MLTMVSIDVFPSNGRRPVRHSYSSTPSENRSLLPSMGRCCTCSGDMYGAVPIKDPDAVASDAVGELAISPLQQHDLRDAEVHQLRPAARRDEHVARLQVAVDDLAGVCGRERLGDVRRER
jgi:hypothetical protein